MSRVDQHQRRASRAFTLIELIVVLGIISFLVVAAIPAMMTFHVRAKVARMKSDLKTVRMCLESYAVDNEAYPLMRGQSSNADGTLLIPETARADEDFYYPNGPDDPLPCTGGFRTVPLALSRPVNYVGNIPKDLFKSGKHFADDGHGLLLPVFFSTGDPHTLDLIYVNLEEMDKVDSETYPEDIVQQRGKYMLFSVGPDTTLTNLAGNTPYDPTNGTVSAGELRTFPNIGMSN